MSDSCLNLGGRGLAHVLRPCARAAPAAAAAPAVPEVAQVIAAAAAVAEWQQVQMADEHSVAAAIGPLQLDDQGLDFSPAEPTAFLQRTLAIQYW